MKKKSSSYYFFIIIIIAMLVIIGYSLTMESFYSKFLPLVIGFTIFILAAVGLRKEILTGDNRKANQTGNEAAKEEEVKVGLGGFPLGGGCVLGFSVAVYLFGFIIAIPLFVISYLKSQNTGWLVTILYAGITAGIIYGIFELALDIVLYRGVLFALIGE